MARELAARSLVEAVANYRRSVASRYRAIKPGELGDLPPGALWLSPKVDGELAGLEFHDGKAVLVTKGGRELPDSPLLRELGSVGHRAASGIRIVGELYCLADGGPRPRVGDVGAALAGNAKLRDRLAFVGFDLLPFGSEELPADHAARLAAIASSLSGLTFASVVESIRTDDRSEVRGAWQRWGASGTAEGVVARTADGRIFKIKPDVSIDAVLMAFTTKCDAPRQVRSVLLGLARDDGTFQLIGGLAGLGGAEDRTRLLDALERIEAPSALRQPSSDGGMFRFVRPEVVVEVNCTDVQAEDSSGESLKRWTLRFDGSGWHGISMTSGISLLHPQLVRVRPDKHATPTDAGFAQIAQRCAPPSGDADAAPTSTAPTIHLRRVWTKSAKDKVAVRKLLVWCTGQDVRSGWPAWIIHFTDYSPDRKNPLERTFRTARSRLEADAMVEPLIAEYVKKGWTEHTPSE